MPAVRTIACLLLILLALVHTSACDREREPELYWIHNHTHKTHNRHCQYYRNCDGHASHTPTGDNCLICGGDFNQ